MDPRAAAMASDPRAAMAQGVGAAVPLNLPPGGPDNPEIMVKIIIPDNKAYDISQGGQTHARLKQIQTSCNVHVRLASPGCYFPGSGDERAALLTGYAESVRVALSQLLEVIEDDPSNPLVHMALPAAVVNSVLMSGGGQAIKFVSQSTYSQVSMLPPLANFEESVIRVARASRTPEAPVVCVANATVMIIRMILDLESNFEFNDVLNYDNRLSGVSNEPDEYQLVPILNPQEAAKQRIELLKEQLTRLAKGEPAGPADHQIKETQSMYAEWERQERQEMAEIEHLRSLPPPPPEPPTLEHILSNAAVIASNLPHVLEIQCMVRIPRINNKQASAIIGVKGANIRDIQEASGCKIKIIDSPDAVQTGGIGPSATSLKEVVVTGQVNQVHGGLLGIAELMNEADKGTTEATSLVSRWLRDQRHGPVSHSPTPRDLSPRASSRGMQSRSRYENSDYDRSKRSRR